MDRKANRPTYEKVVVSGFSADRRTQDLLARRLAVIDAKRDADVNKDGSNSTRANGEGVVKRPATGSIKFN